MKVQQKNFDDLDNLILAAIKEDLGSGDVTTEATIPKNLNGISRIKAKENGIICGLPIVKRVYKLIDKNVKVKTLKVDGDKVEKGDIVAEISGKMRSILTGERLALNFVQRLSGIATYTKKIAYILDPFEAKIYDTRKTTPLWRVLEKYAVIIGGGCNHRFGLFDMYLIKDNHIDVAGSVAKAVKLAKKSNKRGLKIATEARNMDEVKQAVVEGVDLILLDNMSPAEVKKALSIIKDSAEVEISGGITLNNILKYARVGVKRFSSGSLTHSAKALDFSMKISKK